MTVRVVSKRVGGTKPYSHETVVRIDRGTLLGNPFVMHQERNRAKAIAQYKVWLAQMYQEHTGIRDELHELAARVRDGEAIALQCWCAPCACHGDVVIEAIEAINKGDTP